LNLSRRHLSLGLGALALGGVARAEEAGPVIVAETSGRLTAAFARAVDQGADYLACEFTPTRDGVLVAGGVVELSTATDIAFRPEFAARRASRTLGDRVIEGWFVADFDWAEIAGLNAGQFTAAPKPGKAPSRLMNLRDVTHWARAACIRTGRVVGVQADLIDAAGFAALGASPAPALARGAREEGYDWEAAAMQAASADPAVLADLRQRSHVRRLWSAPRPETLAAPDLRAARRFAHGLIVPDTLFAARPDFVGEAAAAGLKVYVRAGARAAPKPRTAPFGRVVGVVG
jgi:glycerophosphoryl diester phosphodiesterase